ncbi:MAG TPA: type II CAAX endopeptidase family protein [Anaerolineales bacterium]|nr:type II CAAX endopeptidase family protein [Anaerolineales bacterium]
MEQNQVSVQEDAQEYSIPWKPIDNWIGILLLIAIDAILLFFAAKGYGTQAAQGSALILVQLVYLLPVLVVFAYRRINLRSIGFGKFEWSTLGLGCGLLIGSYIVIVIHNGLLMLLGVETQGDEILQIFTRLDSPVWFVIVGVIFAPIVEEIFFRGFLFQGFRQKYGWVKGGLLSAAVFAIGHLDPAALIPTFILGLLLAYMYQRTNSVWPGIILHFLVNAFGFCSIYAMTQFPNLIPV